MKKTDKSTPVKTNEKTYQRFTADSTPSHHREGEKWVNCSKQLYDCTPHSSRRIVDDLEK